MRSGPPRPAVPSCEHTSVTRPAFSAMRRGPGTWAPPGPTRSPRCLSPLLAVCVSAPLDGGPQGLRWTLTCVKK